MSTSIPESFKILVNHLETVAVLQEYVALRNLIVIDFLDHLSKN